MEHQPAASGAPTSRAQARRPSSHLVVSHEGRKPLFATGNNSHDRAADDGPRAAAPPEPRLKPAPLAVARTASAPRRAKSESPTASAQPPRLGGGRGAHETHGGAGRLSPGGTRIPRPSSFASYRRGPLPMAECWHRADAEDGGAGDEGADISRAYALAGSPSPAPRPWRAVGARDEAKMPRGPLDAKAPGRRGRAESSDSRSNPPPPELAATAPRDASVSPARRTRSPGRHRDPPSPLPGDDGGSDGHAIPDLVPGIEDIPLASVEAADRLSPRRSEAVASPARSFDWPVEADFTAHDLQVSDSPRIRVESYRPFANRPSLVSSDAKASIRSPPRLARPAAVDGKIPEVRSPALKPTRQTLADENTRLRRSNTKLDEIRYLEEAVKAQIPLPDRNQPRPKNTKLDEIWQREHEGLPSRAYAAARLEEIREQNSTSRSKSPDEARPLLGSQGQRRHPGQASPAAAPESKLPARLSFANDRGGRLPTQTKVPHDNCGERIPDTPITVFKNRQAADRGTARGESNKQAADENPDIRRRDSYNVLRRLARATSASPASEPDASSSGPPPPPREANGDEPRPKSRTLERPLDKGRKMPAATVDSRDRKASKPSVGFKGVRLSASPEPAKSKRSSVQSEADPTDRIEAEIRLFAPHENQSERGSIRAPSPSQDAGSDDDGLAGVTPKADRHDFASMPTPRVTGAYVETPATVKVDRGRDDDEPRPGRRARGLAWNRRDQDSASDPGTSDHNRDGDDVAAAAALRRRRRARSLSRRRLPLRNSAKPPSVKDDLLELQRNNNIEDSTLDDLEEVLSKRARGPDAPVGQPDGHAGSDDERVGAKRGDDGDADEGQPEADGKKRAEDMALIERMNGRVNNGLLNIAFAKQGMDRLYDCISHAGARPGADPDANDKEAPAPSRDGAGDGQKPATRDREPCAGCEAGPGAGAAASTPPPPPPPPVQTRRRLRLSPLGLVLAAAAAWLGLETAMCAYYCRPATCSSGECIFSFDDPSFGAALPVKLDQWATGGRGRELAAWAADEALDLAADAEDLWRGRSVADVPTRGMSHAQKRQHRRRLAKRAARSARCRGVVVGVGFVVAAARAAGPVGGVAAGA